MVVGLSDYVLYINNYKDSKCYAEIIGLLFDILTMLDKR